MLGLAASEATQFLNSVICPHAPFDNTVSLKVTDGVPEHPCPAEAVAVPEVCGLGDPDPGHAVYVLGQLIIGVAHGAELQLIVTEKEILFVFPQLSTAVYVTFVVPCVNDDPLLKLEVNVTVPQASVAVGAFHDTGTEHPLPVPDIVIFAGTLEKDGPWLSTRLIV